MINEINLHRETIISRLNSIAELPKTGLIAGQALASIIYDVLDTGIKGKINDLDIFDVCSVPTFRARDESSDDRLISMSNNTVETDVSIQYNGYSHCTFVDKTTGRGYRVICSFKDKKQPIINKTLVSFSDELLLKDQALDCQTLIESFDFNCVQVGYDIAKDEFFATDDFYEFIKTKQLRVCSVHTPAHTAIRLLKKISELDNAYCNLDFEMDVITTWVNLSESKPMLGEVYRERYLKHEDALSRYFSLVGTNDNSTDNTTSKAWTANFKDSQTLSSFGIPKSLSTDVPCTMFPMLYRFVSGYSIKRHKTNNVHFLLGKMQSKDELTRQIAELILIKAFDKKQIRFFGNICNSKLKSFFNFLCEHNELVQISTYRGFEQILNAIQNLQEIYKTERWFIGLYGTSYAYTSNDSFGASFSIDELHKQCERAKAFLKNIDRAPLVKPFAINGIEISEIVSGTDMMEKGSAHKSCVGGYFNDLLDKDNYYFSFNPSGTKKDLVILRARKVKGTFTLCEAKGVCNRRLNDIELNVANRIVAFVNRSTLIQRTPYILMLELEHKYKKLKRLRLPKVFRRKSINQCEPVLSFDSDIPF